MEIIDYLRIARRRWWILVAVPVLAGLAAAALILSAPASYTTTATVSSGALVSSDGSPFSGPQGTAQFVAAFTAASQNPQTRQAVQSQTGVSAADQADGVAVTPGRDQQRHPGRLHQRRPQACPPLWRMRLPRRL